MSKQNFDSEELVKLFHKIHQRLDWLTCAIKECCSKIPINIGDGVGLFKRLANNKWEFKSLVEGDNITITETTEEIIISSQATPFSCDDVIECLGISGTGESNKFLNEQGDFVTVSGFTCSDLSTCSTTNLVEGTRLYFTDGRAVTALTGQNISLFTNNAGFITSSALTPYLLSSTAASTYEPIITPGTTSQYYRGDKTFQTLDKSTVGLSNVDNTSDANKPISTATQTALDLKANLTQVATVLFKSITPTIITGKTVETSIYAIPLPTDGFNYAVNIYSQAQVSTFAGSGIYHRLRIGTYSSPIDGSTGVNAIGNQTLIATNSATSGWQMPITRKQIFRGGHSGSIYGLNAFFSKDDDGVSITTFSTLASKDFTTQHYLYVTFNPSVVGAVVLHNQIYITLIKV